MYIQISRRFLRETMHKMKEKEERKHTQEKERVKQWKRDNGGDLIETAMRKLYSISKKILYRDSPVISDHSSMKDEVEVQPELARKTVYEDHRRGRTTTSVRVSRLDYVRLSGRRWR